MRSSRCPMKEADDDGPPRGLLIGIGAADWRLIHPLVDAGRMPNLAALIDDGAIGNLYAPQPINSTLAWTTIITGRSADEHNVLGPVKPGAGARGIRPVLSSDLDIAPFWSTLARSGLAVAALNWPVSHPAISRGALIVSDGFADPAGDDFAAWPVAPCSVSDQSLIPALRELRLHPSEVTGDMLLPLVPAAGSIDQQTDARLALVRDAVARTATVHGAATWVAEHRQWDLLAVRYDLLERLCRRFLQYMPPRMPHITEADFEIYHGVIDAAHEFLDMMLGRLIALAGPNTRVMIVSNHGLLSGKARPSRAAGMSIADHFAPRELGVMVAHGPGIRADELVFGATLLDVAPTVAALLGRDFAGALSGRVLADLFAEAPACPATLTPGAAPFAPVGGDGPDDAWCLGRLADLARWGEIRGPITSAEVAREGVQISDWLTLARIRLGRRDFAAALALLDRVFDFAPEQLDARLLQVQCLLGLDNLARCQEAIDDLRLGYVETPFLDYLQGRVCQRRGEDEAAHHYFDKAEASGIGGRRLLDRIAAARLTARDYDAAQRAFERALELDPDDANARTGLGSALAEQGRHAEAVEQLQRSLAALRLQPRAYWLLARSQAAMGDLRRAAKTLETCLGLWPQWQPARRARDRITAAIVQGVACVAIAEMEKVAESEP